MQWWFGPTFSSSSTLCNFTRVSVSRYVACPAPQPMCFMRCGCFASSSPKPLRNCEMDRGTRRGLGVASFFSGFPFSVRPSFAAIPKLESRSGLPAHHPDRISPSYVVVPHSALLAKALTLSHPLSPITPPFSMFSSQQHGGRVIAAPPV